AGIYGSSADAAASARLRIETICGVPFSCNGRGGESGISIRGSRGSRRPSGSLFPIHPCDQVAQRRTTVVTPCERRLLHPAERTDARDPPARESHREFLRGMAGGRETDR